MSTSEHSENSASRTRGGGRFRPFKSTGYTVRRYLVDEFHFRHVAELPEGCRVLDLGGTRIRKRGAFDIERYRLRTVYLNLSTEKRPDVQAQAEHLPFRDGSFDAVICSELLEHVFEPAAILREVHRVLHPRGVLLACAPFLYRIHADPEDFGRYTEHYWRRVLDASGFETTAIERQGLLFSVLADFWKQYLSEIPGRRPVRAIAGRLANAFQRWAERYETRPTVRENSFVRSFTTGFGIVAVRGPGG